MSTILFVDDHHAARTVYAEMLRNARHVVLEAGTLADAEYLLKRRPGAIDLLIVEAVLSTTNGLAVARRLEPLYPEMRVLFISARPGPALRKEGLLPQRAPFLPQPVSAEDLIRRVRQLTQTKGGAKAANARARRRSRVAPTRRAA
jgi:two-component system, cell cycle sensor histidine kinase and response regulator CckA